MKTAAVFPCIPLLSPFPLHVNGCQFDRWVGEHSAKDDDQCDIYILPICSSVDDEDHCGDVRKAENVEVDVTLEVCRRAFSGVVGLYFDGVEDIRSELYLP